MGGLEELTADIRVIAATNQDLAKCLGRAFPRGSLLSHQRDPHRSSAAARRREDIPLLAGTSSSNAPADGKAVTVVSREAMDLLLHDWPGNIRELENAMERAVALELTPAILPDSLPTTIRRDAHKPAKPEPSRRCPNQADLEAHVQQIERDFIAEALRRADGVQVKAADLLGMSFRSFRYYVKKYNLR